MGTDSISKTYFLVFRIPDDGQSPEPQNFWENVLFKTIQQNLIWLLYYIYLNFMCLLLAFIISTAGESSELPGNYLLELEIFPQI
jgi:hypothetical protein